MINPRENARRINCKMGRKPLTPHDAPLMEGLETYIRLAIFATARAHRMDKEDDRVYDWAMDTLIRAGQTYNESKGLQFKSYLIQRCNWDTMRRFSMQDPERRRVEKYIDLVKAHHKEHEEPLDVNDAIEVHLRYLSKRERRILILRSQGKNLSEVAAEVGICKERVRQVQAEACAKVKRRRQS